MKIIFSILFFLATTGCGFKVLNHTEIKNYEILEIKAEGDNKVNFFLKNELNNLLNANSSVDKLIISIKTRKTKSIKEKNKKNQITKYKVNVDSSVELNFISKGIIRTILLSREGFYNVNINHSITRNNQKNIEKNDIVICTALIPGKPAPRILTENLVKLMKPGSIVYDLAAEQGGNSAFSEAGKINSVDGIKIIGVKSLMNSLPLTASNLYAKNLFSFIRNLYSKEKRDFNINLEDEIINKSLIKKV